MLPCPDMMIQLCALLAAAVLSCIYFIFSGELGQVSLTFLSVSHNQELSLSGMFLLQAVISLLTGETVQNNCACVTVKYIFVNTKFLFLVYQTKGQLLLLVCMCWCMFLNLV